MELVGQLRPSGACNLLGVPGPGTLDVDDDECEVVIGIRPKSSPLPRRRSSISDEDLEPEPPMCGSRRVSFADAKGLSLVHVKEFDTWDVPKLPGYDSSEGEGQDAEEYFLSPLTFSPPLSTEELFVKVRDQKVELETIELLPGTSILKGVVRVLNISFSKAVYVRTTLDTWSSHFDLLAEYVPGSSDSLMDCFSFKLTLVPPFGEQGARVDFCLRYETSVGTFWANNNDRNYVLLCHQRVKGREEKPQKENVTKKSCLKTVSQNFSTVENISAMEASSQENVSTDGSKHGEEVDTMKAKQILEAGQKLQAESRRNCSRKSRRKAARMARVRDHFAQRGGGVNDDERNESKPAEAKQAAREETPEEKPSDVQSLPEASSKSEGPQFVSESLETCGERLLDVLHNTSPAHDCATDSEPEKSESINLADSATSTGGESARDIPDNPSHSNDEPAPAQRQAVNKSVSKAEESGQKQGASYERTGKTAAEPADSVISAVSSDSLVSHTNSFRFGTVVAPLYHQAFGRVGSESQNPLNVVDFRHTERRETSCTVPTDVRGTADKALGDAIKTQESNQECEDATPSRPPIEEEETCLSVTANDSLDRAETLQDPAEIIHSDQRRTNTSEVPATISGDAVAHPHTVNILNTDLLNPQVSAESLHLQGEAQEDSLTHDLQSRTAAGTAQARLPERTCAQIQTNLDEPLAQNETREVMTGLGTSYTSLQASQSVSERASDETDHQTGGKKCVGESNKDDDAGKAVTTSTTKDKLSEALHDLNPNHINNSAAKETENGCVSCFEIVEEKDVTTPRISLETQGETNNVEEGNQVVNNSHTDETKHSARMEVTGEVAESMTKAMMSNYRIHGDVFVELNGEDTLKDEAIKEHHGMAAAASKREDFCSADTADAKNWEMMVEEEEKIILTDEEESEAVSLKAEDIEAVEKEDAGTETGLENRYTTEIEVETREEQEETELEKERNFAETQEVNNERTDVLEEEEIEGEEEMEIDLSDDDEAGVEWEDKVKPREDNVEEENPDSREEIVDAESESKTIEDRENEVGCFEERLDVIQNKVEDGLSALVHNVQDKRGTDKENTGEAQNAQPPTEMHLYEEEDFQSSEDVTRDDLSKAAGDENESVAAEGGSCAFLDEPESDQTSHDSTSAESDSDDEVELYMHCLRAVHTGAQAHKDRSKDAGLGAAKRPSVSRSRPLSTPMPAISESLDEEQHLSRLQDNQEDAEAAGIQPTAAALPASSGREGVSRNASWWIATFSCSNISKTLLYATLLVVFLVVAYHYDFLACFGLYLISVIWLCCQGERQPVKNNNRIG